MFTEPHIMTDKKGWIEVVCGSMFSGKTEELIRRLKRAKIANKSVRIFKPTIDNRYSVKNVTSHDKRWIESMQIENSSEILANCEEIEVVGIDEAQFFDDNLPKICNQLAINGIRVIIAGLDMDFQGNPFGPIPNLLSIAEYITKLHAICMICGNIASRSYRIVESEDKVVVGEMNAYEARCRSCFERGRSSGNS